MHTTARYAWPSLIALAATAALAAPLAGCDDPAKESPKASVSDADTASPKAVSEKGEWAIDADASNLGFVGSKVTGKHEGGFKAFTGTAKLVGGKPEGGSVTVEVDTTSVFTDDEKLTGHLKSDDFFDVERHPKATFTSTAIEAGGEGDATHTVTGNLDLHGVTKKIAFPATITVEGDTVAVKSKFSINRKDFEINYKGMPDDLIRDGVVIDLDLKLKRAAE